MTDTKRAPRTMADLERENAGLRAERDELLEKLSSIMRSRGTGVLETGEQYLARKRARRA